MQAIKGTILKVVWGFIWLSYPQGTLPSKQLWGIEEGDLNQIITQVKVYKDKLRGCGEGKEPVVTEGDAVRWGWSWGVEGPGKVPPKQV